MAQPVDWSEVEALDPGRNESAMDLFGIVWRRKWIMLCVTIISLALGYLYYLQATRIYRSVAQVLLVKRDATAPVNDRVQDARHDRGAYGGYEDTLSTHLLLIRSPMIVNRAVEKHHLASLSSLKGKGDATVAVIKGFQANRAGERGAPDPNIMDLRYDGIDPRECATILNAVIQSYQDHLVDTFQTFSEETFQSVTQARDDLGKQLQEKEANYRQFRQESPLLWRGHESANVHEVRMTELEKARSAVLVDNAQIKARTEAIEKAVKEEGSREAIMILAAKFAAEGHGNHSPRDLLEEKIFSVMLEERELTEAYGEDHPKVKGARRRIDLLREKLGNTPLPEGAVASDLLTVYLDSLRQELKVGEKKLNALTEQFETEHKSAKVLAAAQVRDEQFRDEIEGLKKLHDAVVERHNRMKLIKDHSGGIVTQIISPPSLGLLERPKLILNLALAGILGCVVGFSLAYLVDIADKSFRSPEEIRRQLGLPVIGHIPMIDAPRGKQAEESDKVGISPMLCTYHQPKGRPAEAYRAVRTSLYFSTHGEGHKVIQVTSPNPGDGKTTLAANLAVAMADSGKRVLLLEADFRRPRVHKYFGLENSIGVSSIITGEARIADVIQKTSVNNLWAMPCGPRPHNPSDLLTSPGFKELIDELRDQHDFVIVDTPPILAVTDSSVVAPRVDAVLLTVRLTKHARDGASRATEMLQALGARILGVVVNGIGKTSGYGYSGQRYYGGYRYGAGRYYNGYRYSNYSYGYGERPGEGGVGYYEDEAERRGHRRPKPEHAPVQEDAGS